MNRFIPNLSAAKYHADDIGESAPSLTQSIANEMVTRSLWHAWRLHPKLGGKHRKRTKPKSAGTLLHSVLLGDDSAYAVIDVVDFRTKAAQELRDAAIEADKVVLKKSELGELMERAARIDNALRREHGITLGTMERELTAVWSQKTDALGQVPGDVLCRARLDAFDGSTIWDIKTCDDGAKAKLERSVTSFGYHVQGAAYVEAVEHVDIRYAGRVKFGLIFIENDTDAIVVCDLDPTLREMGRSRWQESVNAWHACLTSQRWPGYSPGGPMTLEASEWQKMNSDSEVRALRGKVEHVR